MYGTLTGNENLFLCKIRQILLLYGNTDTQIHLELLADLIELCQGIRQILALQMGYLQKAVQIHLLQIVVLGNDSADKTDKLVAVL